MALAPNAQTFHKVCQFLRGKLFSVNGQRHHIGAVFDVGKNSLPLFFLNLFFHQLTGIVRRLLIRHLNNFQLAVAAEPFAVLCNRCFQVFFFYFSNCNQCNLHL